MAFQKSDFLLAHDLLKRSQDVRLLSPGSLLVFTRVDCIIQ
jgi:hypothetical protein